MRWLDFGGSLTAFLAVLAVASVGFARPPLGGPHGPGHHRGPGPQGFIEEHAAQLGLDEETQIIRTVGSWLFEPSYLYIDKDGVHEVLDIIRDNECPTT